MASAPPPRPRYHSFTTDSGRWDGFAFRPGDIVISTPPKSGTTWMQMLCALLIFDGPEFPAPLEEVSPWLDMVNRPLTDVATPLAAQVHRRFIKTHTPLDGLPRHADVTYLVIGREPRDVAISLEHHYANMDFERFLALRTAAVSTTDLAAMPRPSYPSGDSAAWLRNFVANDTNGGLSTLATVLHHLDTGWQRRPDPNVALFHYADLQTDLPGELLRLAGVLGISCSRDRAHELAAEASLARMRERAADVAPSASRGYWKDVRAFFRSGAAGEWRAHLSASDLVAYDARVAALVSPDLAGWVHRGWGASGIEPTR